MHNIKLLIFWIPLFCLATVSINSGSAQAKANHNQAAVPGTPAGKQLNDWLQVFTSGNQDAFVRFIAKRYSKSLLAEK